MESTTFRDSVINYLWLDANNFFPSIESRAHHFPISTRTVQMPPDATVRVMMPKTERKRCAGPDDLNRLISLFRNLVG